jgi:hypothetical protein
MVQKSAILAAMLIPVLAGDPVVAADTPRKEPSLPAIYSYRAADIASLRQGFAAPPREAGPWVFWIFFDNVMSKAEITRELEEMAAAGIAGAELRFVSIHGFPGKPGPWFDPEGWARLGQGRLEFLSPEFVDALEHACAEAQRLGLRLAINTGMGWPPGGPWITPQYRAKHLAWQAREIFGPTIFEEQGLPPDSMVLAWRLEAGGDGKTVAAGSFRSLTGSIQFQGQSGSVRWDVPEGRWLIGTLRVTLGGLCDKGNGPEADPGSREAVLFHLNHVFGDVRTRDEARRILELVEGGAVLVCCRTMPGDWAALRNAADAEGLRPAFRAAMERGKIVDVRAHGWQKALADAQSVHWLPVSANLSFQHRRVPGGEIYLLTNWEKAFWGDVSFPHTDLVPEIWNVDTATCLPAGQYRVEQERTVVTLAIDSHESAFVVFTRAQPSLHAVRCEGGRAAYDPDGKLCVRLDGPGSCRVELSDGQNRELRATLPPPLALDKGWTLAADPSQGSGLATPVKVQLDKLVSWREIPGLRTYAGLTRYETSFDLPPEFLREYVGLRLELGEVYELADVWLNNRRVGTSWFPPHGLDLTGHVQPGRNQLRIDVPNILKNHMEPGEYARPSGLLGPVRVRPVGRVFPQVTTP